MTMVSTGPISLGGSATSGGLNQSVNVELGLSPTATISMNNTDVRTLFQKTGSGTTIAMSDGYGKANNFALTISTNQTNANLRTLAVNAGWNQTTEVIATINSGVYVSSNSTGTPALTVDGAFPGGVQLINNGFIIGMGGAGGKGAPAAAPGSGGGTALSVSVALTVTNNSTIGGGGGGGGGGSSQRASKFPLRTRGGGGGGGGRTGAAANSAGGAFGSGSPPGQVGSPGTVSAAGAGGAGADGIAGAGGPGGGWGAAGTSGVTGGTPIVNPAAPGGAGGSAVVGNSNITWLATGTRLGAIT